MTSRVGDAARAPAEEVLPTDDAVVASDALDLATLQKHWAGYAARRPMTAESMRGTDLRAQRLGVRSLDLMEQAGTAVAAAVRAVLNSIDRASSGRALILGGPGNNGGDAFVAARRLAGFGVSSVVVLASAAERPGTRDAALNWDRLDGLDGVERIHAKSGHDVALMLNGIERAALIVDGLLGTGVMGRLREPILQGVEVCGRGRELGVPVVAIDTPTALDLTSGVPSQPNLRADLTVTFHRPKQGLLTRTGKAYGGRVLVAPIGIPAQADVG
jgi:hydroxyethylthiazole kinase-like uncharacterized protein yjeF